MNMTKKTKINVDLIGQIGKASESLREKKEQQIFSNDLLKNFPFNIEVEKIEFLRNIVIYKRKLSPEFFHYSNTHAVREGIMYLREIYQDLKQRPKSVKHSTRSGTRGKLYGKDKVKTTFSISENDVEFIYNLIYMKDSNPDEYNKEDFFNDLLKELKKRYPQVH